MGYRFEPGPALTPPAAYGAAMELLEALRTNPSVRDFTDEAVPDAEIAALLDDARFAPSGGNRQPWRVAVVRTGAAPARSPSCADRCGRSTSPSARPESRPSPWPGAATVADLGPQPNPLLDAIEEVPVVLVVAADLPRSP